MDQLESDILPFPLNDEHSSCETEKLELSLRNYEAKTNCVKTDAQILEHFDGMESESIVTSVNLEQESSKPTNSCKKGEFQVEQTEENIQAANKQGSSEGTVLCQITEKAKILASRGPQQCTVETMAEPTSFSLGTGHELVPNERIDLPSQPTENLSALSNCYSRAGYSVLVSNGSLCESTPEMGLVEMENGAAFHIKVQNNNYYAVEVDVTFSGKFLGVWTLEAQQSYPLVIEGSSWESGKLKYFSKSNETEYGMLDSNGKIELEFKPEAMVLIAKHSRLQKRHEVLLTDFKLATVKDLREEINRTLWDQLGCITCLIKGGEVLDEWKFIRSYSLKNGDIIEVLTSEEPILIESSFRDPFTLWVDPHHDSTESVRGKVASKMNVEDLSFLLDEKHIARRGPLTKIFLQSRKPVLKAIKARDLRINVTVHLPSEEAKRVRISQFATVDELMRDLNIPTSGALLRVNDEEIQDCTGLKELLDLGIKNGSEVTVTFPTEGRSVSSYRNPSHESTQEEWADSESHSPSSHNFDCSAEFNPLQYIAEEMYGISGHFNNLEWIGEDKSFCGCYQLDTRRKRFTKDKLKSVTLVVQLCSKRSVTQMLHSYEPPVHFDST